MCRMPGGKFSFGVFEFDPERKELRREGALIHLQAQPGLALAYLLERRGQVVTREELCRAIWGTETFVDFARGLNFCIAQLRAALRDDAANPVYIRTQPKQGYSFIAPVTRTDQANVTVRVRRNRYLPAGVAVLIAIAFCAGYLLRIAHASSALPIVAVMRFDNESGDDALTRFSDNLTDGVVERLTALGDGHAAIIGNATMLRLPREQRDLTAVSRELHARYVVLGQVQAHGEQTRVLAHLIRLPEQTHLWVVRLDRTIGDPLAVEAEIAQRIASEFAPRIADDVKNGGSSPGLSR